MQNYTPSEHQLNDVERFNDIPGYVGYYQVSNLGRVKSVGGRYHRVHDKYLKQKINKYGYCEVSLYLMGKAKTYLVHRLVMLSFVGPSDLTVNHINQNKRDNRLCNLEYMSNKDNVRYSQAHKIKATHILTGEVLHFNSTKEVKSYGFSQGNVWVCLKGMKHKHHNYIWEYESEVV